ncbi:MAG: phosphatidylglycerophosphatase A, partial [Parvibaculum sp.]|nr:phosphatidylglycerophosphatase A [Parvibaculum sp.]
RRFKGGLGVMIDDALAAVCAILAYILIDLVWLVLT